MPSLSAISGKVDSQRGIHGIRRQCLAIHALNDASVCRQRVDDFDCAAGVSSAPIGTTNQQQKIASSTISSRAMARARASAP